MLLRRKADARAVGAAALVGAAEGGRRRPGGRHHLRDGQLRGEDLLLEVGDLLLADQLVVDRGNRVLPDQLFLRHFRSQVAGARAHVAVRQLEPGAREGIGEGLRVLVEPARDLAELRIEAQRQVGGQHGGLVELARDVRVGNDRRRVLGHPLLGAGRRLDLLPFVLEQVLEEVVAPQRRRFGPGDLEAARNRVGAASGAVVAHPAQALRFQRRGFRIRALVRFRGGAMALAEGVAAGDEGDGLLVVHRHAAESGADVLGGGHIVAARVRAFRVDVDQAHVGGAERSQIPIAAEALVDAQPRDLLAPVHVLVRLPHVRAAAAEAEGPEAHGLQRDVACEDNQVGPGDLPAVLLLDRPQQPARLVEVDVVGPTVEGREALLAAAAAAAAVRDPVGSGAVPGHADEERAVVAEVRRPPVLRVGHQLDQVLLERLVVEALELLRVVEALAHRVGLRGMLVQQFQPQLVRPPVAVGPADAGDVAERALARALVSDLRVHVCLLILCP